MQRRNIYVVIPIWSKKMAQIIFEYSVLQFYGCRCIFFHFPFIPFGFCWKWRLFILYRKQIFKPFLLDWLTARKFCIFLSTGTEQAFTQTHIKIIIIRIFFATIIKSESSELISLLTFHRLVLHRSIDSPIMWVSYPMPFFW